MQNSSEQLGEIATNLYQDVAESENLLAEENLGKLAKTFSKMGDESYNLLNKIDDRFALSTKAVLADTDTIEAAITNLADTIYKKATKTGEKATGLLVDYKKAVKTAMKECDDSYGNFMKSINDSMPKMSSDIDTFTESLNKLIGNPFELRGIFISNKI